MWGAVDANAAVSLDVRQWLFRLGAVVSLVGVLCVFRLAAGSVDVVDVSNDMECDLAVAEDLTSIEAHRLQRDLLKRRRVWSSRRHSQVTTPYRCIS